MTNLEKINSIFCEVFSVEVSVLNNEFNKEMVERWDSIHQLSLISSIEDKFDIILDAEDILDFTSYCNAKSILLKCGIEL
ncbi:acyl carrier protein [Bacteroides zoogleoformans]|uniref:acyl carrier protein n=1 Tax=Bacteroides zoogleoformans TaxID=28119 RepID=UPI00248EE545|nr:acyl carrier protein [Bacteroides zoogleoformans]